MSSKVTDLVTNLEVAHPQAVHEQEGQRVEHLVRVRVGA